MLSPQALCRLNRAVCFTAGALVFIALLSLLLRCFSPDIWLDEAYSLQFARYGWHDLLVITATDDIHPPLYYLIVKLFIDIGTAVTSPDCNLIFGKLASFAAILL